MGSVRRLAAHYTLTPEGLLRNIVVTVGEDGQVLRLSSSSAPDSDHGVEFYSGILVPGFINAHCHLELSHMKGLIPRGCGFAGFGLGMSRYRNVYDSARQRESASFHDAKMWSEGISAVGDISNSPDTLGIKSASRQKWHTFVEVYGLGLDSTQRFDGLLRLMKEGGQAASLTPHSMYSLNERLLRETVEGGDGILSVHFMESESEKELFSGRGEMKRWFLESGFNEDFTGSYGSPAERLVDNIPGIRSILLVHNTFVEEEEVDIVNHHFGDKVTWVVCPRSNKYITGGGPPVAMLARKGCRIAVGTDSLASNESLSVLEELKTLPGGLEERLRWATISGARALGMDDTLGSLEPGKKPGVVLIEKADLTRDALTPESVSRRLV